MRDLLVAWATYGEQRAGRERREGKRWGLNPVYLENRSFVDMPKKLLEWAL